MGKVLIIAEKSNAGKDIARVLGLTEADMKDGYMENDKYIVGWARGHLVGQLEPKEIYGENEAWDIDKLPFRIDQETQLKVLDEKGSAALFYTLKKLINRTDIEYIINAGDAAREGELIQRWIYKMAGNKHPVKRFWNEDLTDEGIRKGIKNIKSDDEPKYKNLYEAGKALKAIDWSYGMTYTVLLTKLYGKVNNRAIHYGRCQTPLLNLIVEREREIRNFKKEKYNILQADFKTFKANLQEIDTETNTYMNNNLKFNNDNEKQVYLNEWKTHKLGTIKSYISEDKKTAPGRCFSLSTLQQVLGKKYGYAPDETLELAQSLYEKKLTTYPRTDSEYLSEEIWNEKEAHINSCIDLIKSICGNIQIDLSKTRNKAYVDNTKIEDHHAIIPTDQKANLSSLSEKEKNAYIEICKRYISLFMDHYKYKSTVILIDINNEQFKATGTQEISKGYKILYSNDDKDEDDKKDDEYDHLPTFNIGDTINVSDYNLKELETKPKARFNVASIISLMKKYNIGRPATQASIIDNLLSQKVIELIEKGKKKEYKATELGEQIIDIIPDELKSCDLTSNIEERLKEVEKGNLSAINIQDEVYKEQIEMINRLKESAKGKENSFSSSFSDASRVLGQCPLCGKDIVASKMAYSHKEWKENPCKFSIFKNTLFTTISEYQAQELLTKYQTIGTFKSKEGKTYKKQILMDKNTGKLSLGEYVNTPKKHK